MTAPPAGALEACLALLANKVQMHQEGERGAEGHWQREFQSAAADLVRTHGPALLAALRLREGCEGLVAATHESAAGDMAQCKDEHGAFKSDSHRMAWNFAAGRFEMADDLARVLENER